LYLKNDVEEMRGQKKWHDAILEVGQWRERRECDLCGGGFSLLMWKQEITRSKAREFLRESSNPAHNQ
jgi:hypothetical protein